MPFNLSLYKKDEKTTHFAPAGRYDLDKVKKQNKAIEGSDFLNKVISEAPLMFFILNKKRQVIFANQNLIQNIGLKKLDEALGLRVGEVFQCVNAEGNNGGCGTSENCRYCGAVNAILESDKLDTTITKELRIAMLDTSGNTIPGDFEVISRPFTWNEERHFLILLNNLENTKKKEQLERLFFHDIINKAGSLAGLLHIINEKEIPVEASNLMKMVNRGMKELLDDILFQKELQAAEDGEINITPEELAPLQLIYNLKEDFTTLLEKKKNQIEILDKSDDSSFFCDKIILNRILTNLIKNAIEASPENEIIKIGFTKTNSTFRFSVNSAAVMTAEVKSQIFQRSFSTKGKGRGLGTYSIKLFTEKYLKGKVWFESLKEKGTTFFVEIPSQGKSY